MGQNLVPTLDVLRQFGFVEDPEERRSDPAPGHSFDFGSFKLTVVFYLNLKCQRVASFCALVVGKNSVSQIEFELPLLVESS